MKTPYDIADLGQKLKDAGVASAEGLGAKAYEVLKLWVTESAQLSSTPFDDLAIPWLKQADAIVLPQLDFNKDGKIG